MLTVIAEDIEVFEVRFFDGEEWQIEWPEELASIPELVEVTLAARQEGAEEMAVETFVVSFARPWWRGGGGDGEEEGVEEAEETEEEAPERPRASESEREEEGESE
jgi:hypothetical protein